MSARVHMALAGETVARLMERHERSVATRALCTAGRTALDIEGKHRRPVVLVVTNNREAVTCTRCCGKLAKVTS